MKNKVSSKFQATALVVGYALGLFGWVWDYLEHEEVLRFGEGPAHLVLELSTLIVLAALIPLGSRATRYVLLYTLLALVLYMTQPVAGAVALLGVPLVSVWEHRQDGRWDARFTLAAGGIALMLVGFTIDVFWHAANPGITEAEENMILLPGHQIILTGWILGLAGAILNRRKGGATEPAASGVGG